jgi:hypothetical protein
LLISPHPNLTITVSSSDRWTPFFSVPRGYDALATLCHLLSHGHDHVAETSRADHYRACVATTGSLCYSLPQSVGMTVAFPLRYKKGNPSTVLPVANLACFRARQCRHSCFSLRLVFGQPATSPSLLLLCPLIEQAVSLSSSRTSRRSSEEDREKNPSLHR